MVSKVWKNISTKMSSFQFREKSQNEIRTSSPVGALQYKLQQCQIIDN